LPELAGQAVLDALAARPDAHIASDSETVSELPVATGAAEGGTRYLTLCFRTLTDPTGRVTGHMVLGFDVTAQVFARNEIEAQRRELESARQAAEAASAAKDEFLAMLGHELRNPLAPIVTALQLMNLRGGGTFERERELIARQLGHMVRLVDDL